MEQPTFIREILKRHQDTEEGPTVKDFPTELTGNYEVVLPNIAVEHSQVLVSNPNLMAFALLGSRAVMAEVYRRVAGSSQGREALIASQTQRDEEYSQELLEAAKSGDPDKQALAQAQALLVIKNASDQYRDLFPNKNNR